jgi:hypothetical protein
MAFEWNDFVSTIRDAEIEFEHLKKVQLAQAILESGRGNSDLFKLHGNPFGMKYRPEMSGIAIPVTYEASDGEDIYCKFVTLEDAIRGYWIFINRPVYSGWRSSISSPETYIRFIAFAGYDVFCSIHHNSANRSAQGAEVLVHDRKADPPDLALSRIMSAEIAAELGIRDRIAGGREPRQALGVLSGAEDTDVRVAVLAEVYFIDVSVPDVVDWSTRGGQAIGRAILKWLRANQ